MTLECYDVRMNEVRMTFKILLPLISELKITQQYKSYINFMFLKHIFLEKAGLEKKKGIKYCHVLS